MTDSFSRAVGSIDYLNAIYWGFFGFETRLRERIQASRQGWSFRADTQRPSERHVSAISVLESVVGAKQHMLCLAFLKQGTWVRVASAVPFGQ